jgi:carbamoyl-phosphate synthase large subunit
MNYFIDLDGTLCTQEKNYKKAQPIPAMIKKVNKLYDEGHKITIWTARGATTGIAYDVITEAQLEMWNVKHHHLSFDKPEFDYLVDDKAIEL